MVLALQRHRFEPIQRFYRPLFDILRKVRSFRMPEMRLGDVIDDFCVKCRRVTNHSIVSIINGEAAKVRCRTCYHDHDYRHEQAPPSKKDLKKAELFKEVLSTVAPEAAAESAAESAAEAEPETAAAAAAEPAPGKKTRGRAKKE